jgi:putative ABC transport system ATP-binding protein
MAPPALELRNVRKSYREGEAERVVLRDVSVTIPRGEIVVVLGRSGSGKSTLLNVIAGIDRPTAGSVVVDGTDLTALDEQARTRFRRAHIGFVFQFFNLIPLLTVEENLLLPLDLNGRADAKGIARAHELLERVGLGGRGASYPERLSGGEQQRVAIARALIHDPALILAGDGCARPARHAGARGRSHGADGDAQPRGGRRGRSDLRDPARNVIHISTRIHKLNFSPQTCVRCGVGHARRIFNGDAHHVAISRSRDAAKCDLTSTGLRLERAK